MFFFNFLEFFFSREGKSGKNIIFSKREHFFLLSISRFVSFSGGIKNLKIRKRDIIKILCVIHHWNDTIRYDDEKNVIQS